MIQARGYPLEWPEHAPRTPRNRRAPNASLERLKMGEACQRLAEEMDRQGVGGAYVISSNVETRLDGLPYANRAAPDDRGVAVYFMRRGVEHCVACDRWTSVVANVRAITKTLEALRGIERWGSAEMLEAAYRGFRALPPPSDAGQIEPPPPARPWWEVLGIAPAAVEHLDDDSLVAIAHKRRALSHPDKGGDRARFAEIQDAIGRMKSERRIA